MTSFESKSPLIRLSSDVSINPLEEGAIAAARAVGDAAVATARAAGKAWRFLGRAYNKVTERTGTPAALAIEAVFETSHFLSRNRRGVAAVAGGLAAAAAVYGTVKGLGDLHPGNMFNGVAEGAVGAETVGLETTAVPIESSYDEHLLLAGGSAAAAALTGLGLIATRPEKTTGDGELSQLHNLFDGPVEFFSPAAHTFGPGNPNRPADLADYLTLVA